MKEKTIEKRIKARKTLPKYIPLDTGTKIQFNEAPNKYFLHSLRFEDEYGRYLGALDRNWNRKALRQLQRWVNKCLGESK